MFRELGSYPDLVAGSTLADTVAMQDWLLCMSYSLLNIRLPIFYATVSLKWGGGPLREH